MSEEQNKKAEIIPGTEAVTAQSSQPVQPQINIDVDVNTAIAIKVQEFDKFIAEAKVRVAELERQKATYIYESNIQSLIKQAQQKQG